MFMPVEIYSPKVIYVIGSIFVADSFEGGEMLTHPIGNCTNRFLGFCFQCLSRNAMSSRVRS